MSTDNIVQGRIFQTKKTYKTPSHIKYSDPSMCCVDSKLHSLQMVELSQRMQTTVQTVSQPPPPEMGARFTVFGQAVHADPMDSRRCSS